MKHYPNDDNVTRSIIYFLLFQDRLVGWSGNDKNISCCQVVKPEDANLRFSNYKLGPLVVYNASYPHREAATLEKSAV